MQTDVASHPAVRDPAVLGLSAFVAVAAVQAPPVPGPWPIGWAELAFPVAAGGLAWQMARRRRRISSLSGAVVAAFAYVAWVAVSSWATASGPWVALGAFELATIFCIAGAVGDARDHLLRVWIVSAAGLCAIGLIVAGLAIAGVPTGPLFVGAGELDLAIRPAGLCRPGMLAAFSLVPLLLLIDGGHGLVGRARRPLWVLIGVTVALTLTRTILAVGVGWLLLRRPRGYVLGVILLGLAAIASMRIDLHGEKGQFRLTAQPGIRWRIAASAVDRTAAHPLVGVGPGSPAAITGWPGADDPPSPWDAHSTLLDLSATRGLPAALLWLATVALAVRAALRNRRDPLQLALLAGVGATLFDAVTCDIADFRHVWVLLGLTAARTNLAE